MKDKKPNKQGTEQNAEGRLEEYELLIEKLMSTMKGHDLFITRAALDAVMHNIQDEVTQFWIAEKKNGTVSDVEK